MTSVNNSGDAAYIVSFGPPVTGRNDFHPLVIRIGDQRVTVRASVARDEVQREALIRQLASSTNPICDIGPVFCWPADERRSFLAFCHRLKVELPSTSFYGPRSLYETPDLFELMLSLIAPTSSPETCERTIRGAAEVAALFYPESLNPACTRIVQAIRTHHLAGYRVNDLVQYATEFIDAAHDNHRTESNVLFTELWPDITNVAEMVLPPGWTAGPNWILRTGENVINRINARIAIVRRLRDADGETSLLELAWCRSERWRTRIFTRGELASARNIVGLADYDIPVNSNNAADLIDYLDAFESVNRSVIPEAIVCDRMGWIDEGGVEGFLVGRRLVNHLQLTAIDGVGIQQAVEFRGADQGDEQLADSLQPSGSFERWLALVALLRSFPRVLLAVYASFIPPLLMIFRSRSFILSFAGPTSGGKTTTLACAAATWGCPDQQMPGSLMMTWDTTRVGIERSMRVLNGIPIVIDDTKQARKSEDIAQTVYDVTGGRGRTRGSERGLAATGTWRTVMITSGEQPMTSFSQDGGTRARILELWNSPFGQTSEAMATFVTELKEEIAQHYGHAGPRFVSYLIANRSRWAEWREQYRESRVSYQHRAGANNVASRMSAHIAAIEVGARLVHQALQLPWEYDETVRDLWGELTRDAAEADRAAVGMRLLLNFCATQRHRFVGGEPVQDALRPIPHNGYVGLWTHRVAIGEAHECRSVFVQHVNELLAKEGFEPNSMKRMWRDRGWTTCNPNKATLKVRLNDSTTDAIAIPMSVITQLMDNEISQPIPRPRQHPASNREPQTSEQVENAPNT